jgi:hypothetical protein
MKIEQFYRGKPVLPPVYVYQEFPKWITKSTGETVLVNDEIEEKQHLDADKPKRGRPKNDTATTNDSIGHNQPSPEDS